MENTKIYRIETQSGEGMYTSGIVRDLNLPLYQITAPDSFGPGRHPLPFYDTKLVAEGRKLDLFYGRYDMIRSEWVKFGFGSINQLRNWIYNDDWLIKLHAAGLRLCIYEGAVAVGNTQAIIDVRTMVKIEELSLLTLL
jgi:hypothetical protein